MNKHISIIAGFCAAAFALSSCSKDFLEVKNPTGEPLEEYYTTDERLSESLTSAYAPLLMLPITTLLSMQKSWVTTSG